MKKSDLVNAFVESVKETEFAKTKLNKKVVSKKDADEIVELLFDLMKSGLKQDKSLDIHGLYKMSLEHKEAYTAKNPQTGADLVIAERDVPKCKFSKTFKDYLNA